MSKAIFLVGGGKGGVGKSLMSMALLDFLQAGGQDRFSSRPIRRYRTCSRRIRRRSAESW